MSNVSNFETNPPPIPNSSESLHDEMAQLSMVRMNPQILRLVFERKDFGLKKYGTVLQAFNGRDAETDLVEEIIDAMVYAYQAVVESSSSIPNLNIRRGTRKYEKLLWRLCEALDEFYEE